LISPPTECRSRRRRARRCSSSPARGELAGAVVRSASLRAFAKRDLALLAAAAGGDHARSRRARPIAAADPRRPRPRYEAASAGAQVAAVRRARRTRSGRNRQSGASSNFFFQAVGQHVNAARVGDAKLGRTRGVAGRATRSHTRFPVTRSPTRAETHERSEPGGNGNVGFTDSGPVTIQRSRS